LRHINDPALRPTVFDYRQKGTSGLADSVPSLDGDPYLPQGK
jgi:hypothetical protein